MIRVTKFKAAAVAAAAVAGVAVSTVPAQAHVGSVDISRGSCTYTGMSDHGYAKTEKLSGKCTGHAWLRVNWNGNVSSWAHKAGKQEFTAPDGKGLRVSDHKSCGKCAYKNIKH